MIPTSVTAWEGPSSLTGDRIRLVITGLVKPSSNPKTGAVAQAYILVSNRHPLDILGTKKERAICGDCPLSHNNSGACYVHGRMLTNFRKEFPAVPLGTVAEYLNGKGLRLGAYGDPTAVPFEVWQQLLTGARFHTGYTHLWRSADDRFKKILMASVESEADATIAQALGWRTFRVRPLSKPAPMKNEIVCPSESSGLTCIECKLCSGAHRGAKNIVITAHGNGAKKFASLPVIQPSL